jgi:hypothetical protein
VDFTVSWIRRRCAGLCVFDAGDRYGYFIFTVSWGELELTCCHAASGLYYLSELVEEHTVFAKKLLYQLIYGVIGLQVLLLVVDRFPIGLSALSVVSHVIYAQNLRRFPIVKLTDPLFLLSCGTSPLLDNSYTLAAIQ